MRVCVCTAFTEDYSIGHICAYVNHKYATLHKYSFHCEIDSYDNMLNAIHPRTHCTWYKVKLLLKLLELDYDYILWIDADAVVVNPSITVEELVTRGGGRPLILAENMNSGFLVNAGVLLVANTPWSHMFWRKVWDIEKYHSVFFYEQSALLHVLKSLREGVLQTQPFHSFAGGPKDKYYPNVFIVNHMDLNTNRGWIFPKKSKVSGTEETYSVHVGEAEEECAKFIFHAAGMRNKMSAILGVLRSRGVVLSEELLASVEDFRLLRTSIGGRATAVKPT